MEHSIDRENVVKGLNDIGGFIAGRIGIEQARNFLRTLDEAIAILKKQEAVLAHWDDDTGHWIEGDRNGIDSHTRTTGEMIDTFRCSWCGFYQYWKTPFCPNCGAKMEGR